MWCMDMIQDQILLVLFGGELHKLTKTGVGISYMWLYLEVCPLT